MREGRTVSYGPSFFPFYLLHGREERGPRIEGENKKLCNLQYAREKTYSWGARFSKVPKRFRTRKAIKNSQT